MRSERFSTSEEIKGVLASLRRGEGGPVLHRDNGENFVYAQEGHQLILGVSGAGKSRRGTMPQLRSLIEAGESAVCIDPKGELFKGTACFCEKTHHVRTINFRNPAQSQSWNPLAFPQALYARGERGAAQQMVQEIVFNLTGDNSPNTDRFWVDSERNLLSAILNILMVYASKEQCNFAEMLNIITQDWASARQDDQTVSGGYLSDIMETLPPDSPAKQLLSGYVNLTAKTTKSCIMTEVSNNISRFCTTEDVVAMTSGDDLDLADMDADEPFVLYIILPDDSVVFNVLSGLLVSQVTQRLIKLADLKYNGKLPIRVNFILEELGNIGHSISGLPFLMTASRSRNIRMTLVLQALSQLESIYGRSRGDTILSCADVWVCYRTMDLGTLAVLSRKCGEKTIRAGDIRLVQPLLTESQLMAMETGQALVFISGRIKYIEHFPDYTEMFPCGGWHEVQIPNAVKNAAHKPISMIELKNSIAASKKASSATSFYRKKLFEEGVDL